MAAVPPAWAGSGKTAAASVEPRSLSFVQAATRTSRNQTITISNTGAVALVLGKIAFTGPQAREFAPEISSTCVSGLSLDADRSCELTINFTPTAAGPHSAVLVIPHNADGSPVSITLSGTGTDATSAAVAPSAERQHAHAEAP